MASGERAPKTLWACLDLADHCLGAEGVQTLDVAAALVDRATCALEVAPSSEATEVLAVAIIERSARLVEAYAGYRIAESLRHLEAAKRALADALFKNTKLRRRMEAVLGTAAMNALITYDSRLDAIVQSEGYLVGVGDELLGTARAFLFGSTAGGARAAAARQRLAELEAALDRVDDVWNVAERQIENGYRELTAPLEDGDRDGCAEVTAQLIVGSEQLAVGWEIAVAERRELTLLHGLRVLANERSSDPAIYAADGTVRGFVGGGEEWAAFVECVATRELPVARLLTQSLVETRAAPSDLPAAVITERMRDAVCPPTRDLLPKLSVVVLVALVQSTTTACLMTPSNGESVASTTAPIELTGYAQAANATVQIAAAPSAAGPFTTIATTQASASPSEFWGGAQLYAFDVTAVVPASSWSPGCLEDEAFVRAYGNSIALPTYDHPSVAAEHPGVCFLREEAAGTSFYDALFICASPDSPVARITAPADYSTTHVGDVTIDDAADVAAFSCVGTIDGDLEITGPFALDVSLPALQVVTGDVHIDYPRDGAGVGRTVQLPRFATIGGDLLITTSGGTPAELDFGLEALVNLGRNLTLQLQVGGIESWDGLDALVHVPGDFAIDQSSGDIRVGALTSLEVVDGDVTLDMAGTVPGDYLPSLRIVGGDFVVPFARFTGTIFPALEMVGGDFTLSRWVQTFQLGPMGNTQAFAALDYVGGALTLLHGAQYALLDLGAPTLDVGAFMLTSPTVATLGTTSIAVRGAGAIVIVDNPNLCTSEAEGFVAGQSLRWFGTATIAGNDRC
ncbi:MAG: hypothetical protein RMA76_20050 [Deltaproteobacteria bacterium]|jgi:hypothetical protein